MSAPGLGRVKTPTFNLRVEIPSRFRKFENQKCLRPPLREDDRENNSAHSWLVHVFTQLGSLAEAATSLRHVRSTPRKQTQFGHRLRSGPCQERSHGVIASAFGGWSGHGEGKSPLPLMTLAA